MRRSAISSWQWNTFFDTCSEYAEKTLTWQQLESKDSDEGPFHLEPLDVKLDKKSRAKVYDIRKDEATKLRNVDRLLAAWIGN